MPSSPSPWTPPAAGPGDPVSARTNRIATTGGGTSTPKRGLSGHVSEARAGASVTRGGHEIHNPRRGRDCRIGPGRHPRRRVARRKRHRRSAGGARRDGKPGRCRDAEWQQYRRVSAPQLESGGAADAPTGSVMTSTGKACIWTRVPGSCWVRRRPPSATVAQHYATAAQHHGRRALPTLTRHSLPEIGDSARRAPARRRGARLGSKPRLCTGSRQSTTDLENDPIGHLK